MARRNIQSSDHLTLAQQDFPGSYSLLIRVAGPIRVRVGALGFVWFERGTYAYTGSAMRGVWARVGRHLRGRKKLHWHIDYLLRRREAHVTGVVLAPATCKLECRVNALLLARPGSKIVARGFGSSDCRSGCPSHLIYLGR